MTGLEKILSDIRTESETAAAELISLAEKKATEIDEAAKAAAADKVNAIKKIQKDKARDIVSRAESSAELNNKKATLMAKQQIISEIIAEAKASLRALPDDEYFGVICKLAEKYRQSGKGMMVLGKDDLNRVPADFEKKLNEISNGDITLDKNPGAISDGFLLIYGGIDINCSLDALFDDAAEDLQDIVTKTVFQ